MRGGAQNVSGPKMDFEVVFRGNEIIGLLSKLEAGRTVNLFATPATADAGAGIPIEEKKEGGDTWIKKNVITVLLYSDKDMQGAELRDDGKIYLTYVDNTIVRLDPTDVDWNDGELVKVLKEKGIIS